MQTGKLSINSDNIFPIIKKWLYNEKDIYARELVSNCSDAITKLKKLKDLGDYTPKDENENFHIEVIIDKDNNTIKFIDNGIGMTSEEIDKYINQIAFSGAKEFMEMHQGDNEDNSIIGHFGLGFYSCFMVSENVEIDSLSYQDDAKAVHWECSGDTDFKMKNSTKKNRGTEITLHVSDEGKEYLDKNRMINVLEKYCNYMPYPITVSYTSDKDEEKKLINEFMPVWMKDPKECNDDDYISFYHTNFEDINNPLFWIHLNMDYPVKLKGVLYFPKFTHDYELNEGKVKLYCNQVYVADNIKEVIPDFLLVLKGAIDCPELPLNVSRSFLQSDEYVKKISSYIIKKVADKLKEEKKNDEEKYKELWNTLNTFIKFGCIRNDSFYDKVKDCILFKTINDEYTSINDYVKNITDDKYQKTIYYVSDTAKEASYIKMFKDANLDAVILNAGIDVHFIAYLEQREHTMKFERIDSGLNDAAL
ncbi:MAG: molecular chaperone HtpG, partial [Clostridia bacterium]|nr:molecular chaperone HtpG [Clostridia bacterium]